MNRIPRILIFIISLIFSSSLFALEAELGTRRIGLFIGANNGGPERIRLLYAVNDARNMMRTMTEVGGINSSDALLLIDPSGYTVFQNLDEIASKVLKIKNDGTSRRVEFLFYYSGHSDENGLLVGKDLLFYTTLRDRLKTIDADVTIAILDSCSSGAFTRTKGGTQAAPFLFDESISATGHAFLTSSSASEASQESDKIQGSFFTYYLISGLRGAADSSADNKVTLNELYQHAYKETLSRTEQTLGGPQHPAYEIQLAGTGDLILTDISIPTSVLQFSKDISGRAYIRDSGGRLVAELKKDKGVELSLALPAGTYNLNIITAEAAYTATVFLRDGNVTSLMTYHLNYSLPEYAVSRGDDDTELEQPVVFGEDGEDDTQTDVKNETPLADNPASAEQKPAKEPLPPVFDPDANTLTSFLDFLLGQGEEFLHSSSGFSFSLFPNLGFPMETKDTTFFNFGLVFGYANRIDAVQLSTLVSISNSDVNGLQLSGAGNYLSGSLYGVQIGGVLNITEGSVSGTQIGVGNIGNSELYGAQIGAGFNFNAQNVSGAQVTGVFNYSGMNMSGTQVAGVLNISGKNMNGAQISGVMNWASEDVLGLQLAGVMNYASTLNGIQIGLINYASQMNGLQIGLINIATKASGLPLGLVNISSDGIMNYSFWYETNGSIANAFQSGGDNFYTIFYVGMNTTDLLDLNGYFFGGGIGSRFELGILQLENEISLRSGMGDNLMLLPVVKLDAGIKLGKTTFFGGVNAFISHESGIIGRSDFSDNIMTANSSRIYPVGDFDICPVLFAGVRF